MRLLLLAGLLLAPLCMAAQSYTITTGAITFQPLAAGNNLNLGFDELSATIAPPGFSFVYFGATYTEFKVGSNGFVIMGSAGTISSYAPDPSAGPGLTIAPMWRSLIPNQYSSTLWEFAGGVLTVEWRETTALDGSWCPPVPIPNCNMQVRLDTASGDIEFHYARSQHLNSLLPNDFTLPDCCSIAGPTGAGPQQVIRPAFAPYIAADGKMDEYPVDMFIHFDAGFAPAITGTPVKQAYPGHTYSYTFGVSGGPAPGVSVTGLPAWLSFSGNTLSGVPNAADVGTIATIRIEAINTAGTAVQQFHLSVLDSTPPPAGGSAGGGGCAAGVGGSGLWLAAVLVLAGLAMVRSRMAGVPSGR